MASRSHVIALVGLLSGACVGQTQRSAPIHPATGTSTPTPPEPALTMRAPRPPEATPDLDAFAWWDRDGDGTLTEDELTAIWIGHLDRDGDGVVTRSEWPS